WRPSMFGTLLALLARLGVGAAGRALASSAGQALVSRGAAVAGRQLLPQMFGREALRGAARVVGSVAGPQTARSFYRTAITYSLRSAPRTTAAAGTAGSASRSARVLSPAGTITNVAHAVIRAASGQG